MKTGNRQNPQYRGPSAARNGTECRGPLSGNGDIIPP